MISGLKRHAAFAAYQLALFAGIALLVVAVPLARLGVTIPYDRILTRLRETAFEDA